jgi:signal transduction histidine kinase
LAGGLAQQIQRLRHCDHVCLIYDSFADQMAALVPFIQEGLARGECCAYIVDDRTAEEVAEVLVRHGVDLTGAQASGAFVFLTKRDAYLKRGVFEPAWMIDFLRQVETEALAKGFTALRVTGEMTWALGPETGCERLIEYEALLNRFFPGSHSLAICQYSRDRFPPEFIRDVLRTHPLAIVREEVHENLFYETPEMVLGQESAATRVEWMLEQLQRVRATERTLVELSERLAEQATENARLYQEAQAAVRLRDEFLGVASHELKTPLTPLRLKLQSLKREAQGSSSGTLPAERVARALEGAESQVRRLDDLINDLLDVSRLSEGRLSLELAEVDLADTVREVAAQFAGEAARVECQLEVHAAQPLVGHWDRQRLEQVVINLLTNALKYGAGKPVRLAVEAVGPLARLTVRDEGIGIAPEHFGRIFGKFERAVSDRHYGGLGLGLYITRQLVQAMGGEITVWSRPDEGARFTVELPRTATLQA